MSRGVVLRLGNEIARVRLITSNIIAAGREIEFMDGCVCGEAIENGANALLIARPGDSVRETEFGEDDEPRSFERDRAGPTE